MRILTQMAWLTFLVFIGIIGLSHQQKASLKLDVEPGQGYIKDGRSPASMLCTLRDGEGEGVPLAGCEFSNRGVTWDFDQGPASTTKHPTVDNLVVHADYFGTGLENGDCGLALTGLKSGTNQLLRCRVRPAAGGAWLYAAMTVVIDGRSPMQYLLQPSGMAVVLPDSDVTILGSSDRQINECFFWLPSDFTKVALDDGTNWVDRYSSATSESVNNYVAWREGKQCGVTLRAVQSSWSGPVVSMAYSNSRRISADVTMLVVASPPVSQPHLKVTPTKSYKPGDVLNATCVVGPSLPVSNLTWYLGERVVRNDNWNEALAGTAWTNNIEPQVIEQRLLHTLSLADNGKALKCRAGHLALLPSGKRDSKIYTVRVRAGADACKTKSCGPHSKCRVVGGVTTCSCLPHYIGKPPSCRPECDVSADCPTDKACVAHVCLDQCPADCGEAALCQVVNHLPLCVSPEGFGENPLKLSEEIQCGRRYVAPTLISGGQAAKKGEYPWHAAIFHVVDAKFKLICGGTLIKPNIVISAAHCFILTSYQTLKSNTSVKVALGKLRSSWSEDMLDTEIAGWGLTTTSTETSPDLQRIDLPLVDKDTCRNGTQREMKRYLTGDKFCAGYVNQSMSVCPGDSGGGLVFSNSSNNRYYLRGVVSTTLSANPQPGLCMSDHYTSFTSVGEYTDWIKRFF